jgi:hypothetical protein
MAIILVNRALVSGLTFHAASGRERDRGNDVGIREVKDWVLVERDIGRSGSSLDDPNAEISLHSSKAPTAGAGQKVDDFGGIRI